jgi:hypothetical protein
MSQTVRFASTNDIASVSYTATTIPTTETAAIVINDIETYPGSSTNTAIVGGVGGNTQATLFIDFTLGTATNCIIKFYGSYKGDAVAATATDWFIETEEASTTGTLTLYPVSVVLTAGVNEMWHFPIGACRSYKVTVTTTGTVTSSALKLTLGLRSN